MDRGVNCINEVNLHPQTKIDLAEECGNIQEEALKACNNFMVK